VGIPCPLGLDTSGFANVVGGCWEVFASSTGRSPRNAWVIEASIIQIPLPNPTHGVDRVRFKVHPLYQERIDMREHKIAGLHLPADTGGLPADKVKDSGIPSEVRL